MTSRTSTPDLRTPVGAGGLRSGDRVRVRSREEILATLDADGRSENLPFMPEMLKFAGRTLPVDSVVHRTCDTVSGRSELRGMTGTVHLRDARCDGSAHGGCQARCLLYWRQEWLEPVGTPQDAQAPGPAADDPQPDADQDVPAVLAAAVRGAGHRDDDPVYSCQATRMPEATCPVSGKDVRLWVKDVQSRNARVRTAAVSFAAHALTYLKVLGRRWPKDPVPTGEKRRHPPLNLQPGDLVEVKSLPEIEATLDQHNRLRGLFFAVEMTPYCGRRARVLARVERIIDEKTGRMLSLRDCLMLEDVWCDGRLHFLCGRKIYAYWREAWLRRAPEVGTGAAE